MLQIFLLLFVVFGVVGQQLFGGNLNQYCYSNEVNGTYTKQAGDVLCGSRPCDAGYVCLVGTQSPGYSCRNFNDFGHACLTIFIALTLEGWVDVMYEVTLMACLINLQAILLL